MEHHHSPLNMTLATSARVCGSFLPAVAHPTMKLSLREGLLPAVCRGQRESGRQQQRHQVGSKCKHLAPSCFILGQLLSSPQTRCQTWRCQPATNPKEVVVIWHRQRVPWGDSCHPGAGLSPLGLCPQWSFLHSRVGMSIRAGASELPPSPHQRSRALAPCRRSTKHPWEPVGTEGMLARGGGQGGFGHLAVGRLADPGQCVHCPQVALGHTDSGS